MTPFDKLAGSISFRDQMKNALLQWGERVLKTHGWVLKKTSLIIKTPWSEVYALETNDEIYYLKKTPRDLFIEVTVFKKIASTFEEFVPIIVASNESLSCFITKDEGISLRKYLQNTLDFEFLYQGLEKFLYLQQKIESIVNEYLALGVPDWRLNQFPKLFNTLLKDEQLLAREGIKSNELKKLKQLTTQLKFQCEALAFFGVAETFVQTDFHSNNIMINPTTKKLCFLDLGEVVITHPLFSIINFLSQAIKHHGFRREDAHYPKKIS